MLYERLENVFFNRIYQVCPVFVTQMESFLDGAQIDRTSLKVVMDYELTIKCLGIGRQHVEIAIYFHSKGNSVDCPDFLATG